MTMTRIKTRILMLAVVGLAPTIAGIAAADTYPISGRWTYRDVTADGPSKTCNSPTMEFRGDRRFDTSGGVPRYINVDVERTSASSFMLRDLFLTAPNVRGHVNYTLRLVDEDHIVVALAGKTFVLRRCE